MSRKVLRKVLGKVLRRRCLGESVEETMFRINCSKSVGERC